VSAAVVACGCGEAVKHIGFYVIERHSAADSVKGCEVLLPVDVALVCCGAIPVGGFCKIVFDS
jgi:hypothetical protein